MKRPQELIREIDTFHTIVTLTNVFEGIASMRIAQIKNQVLKSQSYFSELWQIYKQIHVSYLLDLKSTHDSQSARDLTLIVTSEGGFSGDIDSKLVDSMLEQYDRSRQDIIVIGHHGATLIAQHGVPIKKYYKLPIKDTNLNLLPIINELPNYRTATVYYQTYVSLMVQEVKQIELKKVVANLSQDVISSKEYISEDTYIFEPNTAEVVEHMEASMMGIALGQVILESKLAQYASRFRAMSVASKRAKESLDDVHTDYNRAKRAAKDERLKEIINGLTKVA